MIEIVLLNAYIEFSTSGQNYTAEYDAIYEVANATLPFIRYYPNGSQYLEWKNEGGICFMQGMDTDYYNHNMTLMATISGHIFNQLMEWMPSDNATWPTYELFYVWDEFRHDKYIQSSTCVEFTWRLLQKIHGMRLSVVIQY